MTGFLVALATNNPGMRELTSHKVNGCNEKLEVTVRDEPGSGGACHHYRIEQPYGVQAWKCDIRFQNGPVLTAGTNGVTHESLLAIIEDRLASFQNGPYACEENGAALYHIQEAQRILKLRTERRVQRGVEGTHQP